MKTTLIDGDLVCYRCAASAEQEEAWVAKSRADSLIARIADATEADNIEIYLSGSDNFRYTIYPQYKANRTQERPKHLETMREQLILDYGAKVTYGYETDDALAMRAVELGDNATIASLDKDLRQVPGRFYSWEISGTSVNGKEWVKAAELVEVSEIDGLRAFYRGLLIGDRADNIVGAAGIGEVKAAKAINPLNTEEDMFDLVKSLYNDDKRLLINGQLMWLLRKEGEVWPYGQRLASKASLSALSEVPQEGGR